ncbi:hypothetical protein C1H76_0712 [Elsinoe australis]|uniref:Uncharacterized protein n=1 Tax=Elsinoe australis TaxID=40998 RepID=A0A4U7B6D4_9PEZI|nr:hypothetical protein C1H76_0712 [Elsinoe australis]
MKPATALLYLASYLSLTSATLIDINGRKYIPGKCQAESGGRLCRGSFFDRPNHRTTRTRTCTDGSCVGKALDYCTISLADDEVLCPGYKGEAEMLAWQQQVAGQGGAGQGGQAGGQQGYAAGYRAQGGGYY